jgi:hypothetical protein
VPRAIRASIPASPERPQPLLGKAAHELAFVAQPLVQEGRVGHAAAVRDPDDRFGARRGVSTAQAGERLATRFRRLGECRRRGRC